MTERIKGISWLNGAANISARTLSTVRRVNSKKITVSIPLKVLKILTDERTRRQVNNLRHATNSELLCEAFLHAFTGQPLPNDEDLRKERSDEIPEEAKVIMRELGIDPDTWEY
jgi:MetJ family methionine regulon transcriptional repressor